MSLSLFAGAPLCTILAMEERMLKKHAFFVVCLLFVLAWKSPVSDAKHCVLLGTAHVDKSEDHKTIHVGNEAGAFHKIHVNDGAVEVQCVVVHFGNGRKKSSPSPERVRPGGKRREIELPGEP
jgi:hypothetical protein